MSSNIIKQNIQFVFVVFVTLTLMSLQYNNRIEDCLAENGIDCLAASSILNLASMIPQELADKLDAASSLVEVCGAPAPTPDPDPQPEPEEPLGDFISTWATTSSSESITLPLRAGFAYNFTVDWGDGSPIDTVTSDVDADRIHVYAVAGTYTVTIGGVCETFYFNNSGDRTKIKSVVNLGNVGWTSLENAFYGCNQMTSFAGGDVSSVTDMSGCFRSCSGLVTCDLATWNTSLVTTMANMFNLCINLPTVNLSAFNTAAVTSMANMFASCFNLVTVDVSWFNTAAVTNMSSMFAACFDLTVIDVSGFDTSLVTTMLSMFSQCNSVTTIDVSGFNTSSVITMTNMFFQCTLITALDVSGFDTSLVTAIGGMFSSCANLTSIDVSTWDVGEVLNMSSIFLNCTALAILDISPWRPAKATTMSNAFQNMTSIVTLDFSGWDTTLADPTMHFTLNNCPLLTTFMPPAVFWENFDITGHNLTFTGSTAIVNYADIDVGWK